MLAFFLHAVAALVACVPFADLRVLGEPLAWLAGSVLRIRADHVERAMQRARLPGDARAMYASLATGVMELLWLAAGPRRDLREVATLDPASKALLDGALAEGRGAVLGASHTGNWELAACALAERVALSVLVKRVSVGGFERFLWRMRERYGVGLLEGEGALGDARREIEARRVVAVLIDQVPAREEHGEWLPFLGEPALTERAAATLAAATGAPFVVTASRRGDDGRHVLHVLSVKRPPPRGRAEWVRRVTREATEELEAFVRAHPSEWLWMHRRWKRQAPMVEALGTPPPAPVTGSGSQVRVSSPF